MYSSEHVAKIGFYAHDVLEISKFVHIGRKTTPFHNLLEYTTENENKFAILFKKKKNMKEAYTRLNFKAFLNDI